MEAATALWRDYVVLFGPGIVGLESEPSNLPYSVDEVHRRQTKRTACFILRPLRLHDRFKHEVFYTAFLENRLKYFGSSVNFLSQVDNSCH